MSDVIELSERLMERLADQSEDRFTLSAAVDGWIIRERGKGVIVRCPDLDRTHFILKALQEEFGR